MPTTITEKELELEFDDDWDAVLKWDDTSAYRDGIQKLGESKAVDVLAFSRSREKLLLIELKRRVRWLTPRALVLSRDGAELDHHGIVLRTLAVP